METTPAVKTPCESCAAHPGLPEDIRNYATARARQARGRSHLIPVLHKLQERAGYLRREDLADIADIFGLSTVEVIGVATFYHYFTLTPRGEHTISVCLGTACHVKGAGKVMERLRERLGIGEGQTTEDGLFTMESARCVGMCALAPVVLVDDKVYGSVTVDDVDSILAEYGFGGDKT